MPAVWSEHLHSCSIKTQIALGCQCRDQSARLYPTPLFKLRPYGHWKNDAAWFFPL